MSSKIYSMLGLAQKAGKLVSGDEGCEITIKSKKCYLVIVAKDATERTKKKFKNICNFRKIKIIEFGEKERIGKHIGKGIRSIIALIDINFANKIELLIVDDTRQSGGESYGEEGTRTGKRA